MERAFRAALDVGNVSVELVTRLLGRSGPRLALPRVLARCLSMRPPSTSRRYSSVCTWPTPAAANVLFHVVNDRHLEKRSLSFTTDKSPLTAWGDVLHGHDLAEAIVDRTLERGRLLVLDGPSYRTRHLPALDLPDPRSNDDRPAKPDRISGTHTTHRAQRKPVSPLRRPMGAYALSEARNATG